MAGKKSARTTSGTVIAAGEIGDDIARDGFAARRVAEAGLHDVRHQRLDFDQFATPGLCAGTLISAAGIYNSSLKSQPPSRFSLRMI